METASNTTVLHETHLAFNARKAPFAGYDMPTPYEDALAEHSWMRHHTGQFDVSYMGQRSLKGPGGRARIERLTPDGSYIRVTPTRPVAYGVNMMHIDLYKDFSTPHGGSGTGSGPICVSAELTQIAPKLVVKKENGSYRLEAQADRPGSCGQLKGLHSRFGIHVRAPAYTMRHVADGPQRASEDAVLGANYLMARLKPRFHAPFGGPYTYEYLLTDKGQKAHGMTTLVIAKAPIEKGFLR